MKNLLPVVLSVLIFPSVRAHADLLDETSLQRVIIPELASNLDSLNVGKLHALGPLARPAVPSLLQALKKTDLKDRRRLLDALIAVDGSNPKVMFGVP